MQSLRFSSYGEELVALKVEWSELLWEKESSEVKAVEERSLLEVEMKGLKAQLNDLKMKFIVDKSV